MSSLATFRPVSPLQPKGLETISLTAEQKFVPATIPANGKEALPPQFASQVPKFAEELSKNVHLMDYGKPATDRLQTYADNYLDSVQLLNMEEFAKPLTEVLVACSSINANSITTGKINARLPFFTQVRTWFVGTRTRVISQFNTVREQIDSVVKEVNSKEQNFRNILKTLDDLYMLNMNEYYNLGAYMQAAKVIEDRKTKELQTFVANNKDTTDPLIINQIQEKKDWLDELGRVYSDLERIQFTCVQFAQRCRQQQRTVTTSIRKFDNIKTMAIPLWKKNAAEVITAIETRKGISFGNKIADTTNMNYKTGAELVAKNAVDAAKMLERGVIDFESLNSANTSLITSINEILQITEAGKAERASTEKGIADLKASINQHVVARSLS